MTQKVRIDGIDWYISDNRTVQPICPIHHLRMRSAGGSDRLIKCQDCEGKVCLPRSLYSETLYVLDRMDAKVFKGMKVLNLDDEALPIAEAKVSSEDEKYFVTARLMESKVGLRLVVYAGEKGKSEKTQIFIEPAIKRLAFDQKDTHPTDVFIALEATFADGTKSSIMKK
jgi:hypothetical protein